MNAQLKEVKKQTRNRAILRAYDYTNGTGTVKDANTQAVLTTFNLSSFPDEVIRKLALSAAMGMIAGAGVEAHNDGEDVTAAMDSVVTELTEDKVEFRDGVGVAMGGTLKRIARALVDLGKTYIKAPNGETLKWEQGDLAGAFDAMRQLWAIPEDKEAKTESGRARINRVKAIPEVAAKLASYAKGKGTVELG